MNPRPSLTRAEWRDAYRVARVRSLIGGPHRGVNFLALRYAESIIPRRPVAAILAALDSPQYVARARAAIN